MKSEAIFLGPYGSKVYLVATSIGPLFYRSESLKSPFKPSYKTRKAYRKYIEKYSPLYVGKWVTGFAPREKDAEILAWDDRLSIWRALKFNGRIWTDGTSNVPADFFLWTHIPSNPVKG